MGKGKVVLQRQKAGFAVVVVPVRRLHGKQKLTTAPDCGPSLQFFERAAVGVGNWAVCYRTSYMLSPPQVSRSACKKCLSMAPPVPHRYTHAGTLRAGVRVFMAESYKLPFRPDPYTPTAALSNIAGSAVTGAESLKDLHDGLARHGDVTRSAGNFPANGLLMASSTGSTASTRNSTSPVVNLGDFKRSCCLPWLLGARRFSSAMGVHRVLASEGEV
jgi:hypothetical protein